MSENPTVFAPPAPPERKPLPPAGWYPNPDGSAGQRYWNGDDWTEHYHGAQPAAPSGERLSAIREPLPGLVVLGYVTAVLMPLVGFILGLVAATRPDPRASRHGVFVILVSIVAFIVFFALIAASDGGSTGYSYY